MTHILPQLLITVLFGIEASFSHPGYLTEEKEKLGDEELKKIIKQSQTSVDAREALAFDPIVWSKLTSTLSSGINQLVGAYIVHDRKNASYPSCYRRPPPPPPPPTRPSRSELMPVGMQYARNAREERREAFSKFNRDLTYNMPPRLPSAPLEYAECDEHGKTDCRCANFNNVLTPKEKMHILPRVHDLVHLGRNLMAAGERGQNLATDWLFTQEIRRLCELCTKSRTHEAFRKILVICLQYFNNLIVANERQKMSLWMHLFVPGSTKLAEAARRKANRQIKAGTWRTMSAADWYKYIDLDFERLVYDLEDSKCLFSSEEDTNRITFFPNAPYILDKEPKDLQPYFMILHSGVACIEGMDELQIQNQGLRTRAILASEAGVTALVVVLSFFDLWYEVDPICTKLMFEIIESIIAQDLLVYLFESMEHFYTIDDGYDDNIGQAHVVILRILHVKYGSPSSLKMLDAAKDSKEGGEKKKSSTSKGKKTKRAKLVGDDTGLAEVLKEALTLDSEENAPEEFWTDFNEPLSPKAILNFVRYLGAKTFGGHLTQLSCTLIVWSAKKRTEQLITSGEPRPERLLPQAFYDIFGEEYEQDFHTLNFNIFHMLTCHEVIVSLLELFVVFCETKAGADMLKSVDIVQNLLLILQCLEECIPRSTLKSAIQPPAVSAKTTTTTTPLTTKRNGADQQATIYNFGWPNLKKTIINLLGVLCHGDKVTQDLIRDHKGIPLVLMACNIDNNNPYIREYAILCIRNLLVDNPENQKIVRELEAKTVIPSEELERNGIQTSLDEKGKVIVTKGC